MSQGQLPRLTVLVFTLVAGGIAVFLWLGVPDHIAPWMMQTSMRLLGLGFAVATVVGLSIAYSPLLATSSFTGGLLRASAIWAVVCLPVLLGILMADITVRKRALLAELGVILLLMLATNVRKPRWFALAGGVLLLAIGLPPLFTLEARASLSTLVKGDNEEDVEFVFSSLHDLRVITANVAKRDKSRGADRGGAIEVLDPSRLLLLDGNGLFYLVGFDGGAITSQPLSRLRSPTNADEYARSVKQPSIWFSVTDLLVVDDGVPDQRMLYVVHHHWDNTQRCIVMKVDEAALDLRALDRDVPWTTRFVSKPCISTDQLTNETGGRLEALTNRTLLLTVGVTLLSEEVRRLPADLPSDLGKIIAIDRDTWTSRVFSQGHRNPQGLLVDGETVWSTEHGPEGGDELNRVVEGGDYGWPASSYGTDYGQKTLYGSATPGDHTVGIRPLFAWVPSVGISRLLRVRGEQFSAWRGDLLIGSLGKAAYGRTIYRARIRDGQVQVVEPIPVGIKVRDLVEMPDGALVIWDGQQIIERITSAKHVFAQCSGCHPIPSAPVQGVAPSLLGIIGRPVASVEGFGYSQAMKEFGGVWTPQRLDAFLADPILSIPGNNMKIDGIADPVKRREIVDYLTSAGRRGADDAD